MTTHILVSIYLKSGMVRDYKVRNMENAIQLLKAARDPEQIIKVAGYKMTWINPDQIDFIEIEGNQKDQTEFNRIVLN